MPFTVTHVVAVIPFWPLRRSLPFTALAVGAMVPDLPLFFPSLDYALTHSPVGAWTFCLPVGLIVFLLFESVMRRPLTALLPKWMETRLPVETSIPIEPKLGTHLRYFVGVALAIVIGAYTHQIWDAFTHQDRWGTRLVPGLNAQMEIGDLRLPGYKLFQYGSTFVGLPLLTLLAAWQLKRATPDARRAAKIPAHWKLFAGTAILVVPLCVGAYALMVCLTFYEMLGMIIKRSGAIILLGLVIYCLLFQAIGESRRLTGTKAASD